MKSRIKFILVILTMATLVLSACQPQTTASITGTWILSELNGNPVASDANIILILENGTLSGSDGCNHLGGSYSVDEEKFNVGEDMVGTLMACEEAIMQRAGEYTQALQNAATFKVVDAKLQLLDESDSVVAVFDAQSQELAGTSWLVNFVSTASEDGVVSSLDSQPVEQTLAFDAEGKFNGNAGCNSYFGSYEVEENNLSLGAIGATKMACEEDAMQAESTYLSALEKAATYQITGQTLQIRDAEGNTLVTFSKQ